MVLLPGTRHNEFLLHEAWTIRNECPTCFSPAGSYPFGCTLGPALIAELGMWPVIERKSSRRTSALSDNARSYSFNGGDEL